MAAEMAPLKLAPGPAGEFERYRLIPSETRPPAFKTLVAVYSCGCEWDVNAETLFTSDPPQVCPGH
jgi:hypothetical protein